MTSTPLSLRRGLATAALALGAAAAHAADLKTLEQALAAAQQDKRGVNLYVAGQTIGGAVVRVEAGQWVEMRSQQYGRILVRLDRIDGMAAP